MSGNGEWMGVLAQGFMAMSIVYAVFAGVVWAVFRVRARRAAR